jgi:hypothetical protein
MKVSIISIFVKLSFDSTKKKKNVFYQKDKYISPITIVLKLSNILSFLNLYLPFFVEKSKTCRAQRHTSKAQMGFKFT